MHSIIRASSRSSTTPQPTVSPLEVWMETCDSTTFAHPPIALDVTPVDKR